MRLVDRCGQHHLPSIFIDVVLSNDAIHDKCLSDEKLMTSTKMRYTKLIYHFSQCIRCISVFAKCTPSHGHIAQLAIFERWNSTARVLNLLLVICLRNGLSERNIVLAQRFVISMVCHELLLCVTLVAIERTPLCIFASQQLLSLRTHRFRFHFTWLALSWRLIIIILLNWVPRNGLCSVYSLCHRHNAMSWTLKSGALLSHFGACL